MTEVSDEVMEIAAESYNNQSCYSSAILSK